MDAIVERCGEVQAQPDDYALDARARGTHDQACALRAVTSTDDELLPFDLPSWPKKTAAMSFLQQAGSSS
jgi:hypothetical protein